MLYNITIVNCISYIENSHLIQSVIPYSYKELGRITLSSLKENNLLESINDRTV